jgi:hypothetical protein
MWWKLARIDADRTYNHISYYDISYVTVHTYNRERKSGVDPCV